jgi:hypothetical protein
LGRNQEENELLEGVAERGDILIKRKDSLGPTALIRRAEGKNIDLLAEVAQNAQKQIWCFSKKKPPLFKEMKWKIKRL